MCEIKMNTQLELKLGLGNYLSCNLVSHGKGGLQQNTTEEEEVSQAETAQEIVKHIGNHPRDIIVENKNKNCS